VIGAGASSKAYDVVLVIHAVLAIATLVVLLTLRSAAVAVQRHPAPSEAARRTFSGRREVAGRTVHLLPLSGLALLGLSQGRYGLVDGFVLVGLALWLVAAALLEGTAFPAQREVAALLKAQDPAVRAPAVRCQRSVELAALCVVAAAIVMIANQSG
jgi:hypothetical protein